MNGLTQNEAKTLLGILDKSLTANWAMQDHPDTLRSIVKFLVGICPDYEPLQSRTAGTATSIGRLIKTVKKENGPVG